jgi:hypothetical protein
VLYYAFSPSLLLFYTTRFSIPPWPRPSISITAVARSSGSDLTACSYFLAETVQKRASLAQPLPSLSGNPKRQSAFALCLGRSYPRREPLSAPAIPPIGMGIPPHTHNRCCFALLPLPYGHFPQATAQSAPPLPRVTSPFSF